MIESGQVSDVKANVSQQLGPLVAIEGNEFVIDGKRFGRRQYHKRSDLEIVPRPADPASWDSQLLVLASPLELEREVPDESETFSYLSPTMARILRRIAEVDTAQTQRGFVLLLGPTGCGKTTMAKTYCRLANQPCTELTFSGDTALSDFFTSVELVRENDVQTSTLTVPGPAVDAMLRGKKLLLNEINMLPPDLLNVFSQAMDTGRVVLSGTERGNVEIQVHKEFGLIGTANPNYVGTLDMGRAFERRFGRGLGFIEMDFLPIEEEARAIGHEFARERLFAQNRIVVDPAICTRLAELANALRRDEQIGNVMRSRLSTRALVSWLGLAQITGLPLVEVLEQALLTTAPSDARQQAIDRSRQALGNLRLDLAGTEKLRPYRVTWPSLQPGEAVALDRILPPIRHPDPPSPPRRTSVVHRVRFVRRFPDGRKALIAEPMLAENGRRYGLGLRIRAYDSQGRQITDPAQIEEIASLLRDEDGLNVPGALGRKLRPSELLPCLTRHAVTALEL
ncbi:MAG TPA: AAA family ATPase, partial [Chloroflexota bacterium]|nr:AAA family ATPase [Chloroflexota bacterium]